MEQLKKQILAGIPADDTQIDFADVRGWQHLVRREIVRIGETDTEAEIWTDAINRALAEARRVEIPDLGHPVWLDDSLILTSGNALRVSPSQIIGLLPGRDVCLVRNANLIPGNDTPVTLADPDTDLSVEGGIWTSLNTENGKLCSSRENPIPGTFAIMLLSNVERIRIRNVTFRESTSYAVQISNAKSFLISDIRFESYHKDGIHVNGPASFGVIKNLSGDDMGDDMVALNAWDWHSSAMTFGTIDHILVENVTSTNNEFRLLPGQKVFSDGRTADCDIHSCILSGISGVYTYKLYAQPFWLNEINGLDDTSGTVGRMHDLYFEDIVFPRILTHGFADRIAVRGLFEICADCENILIRNVRVAESADELAKKDITLVKVGPLTATLKLDPDDPAKWGELFDPDAVCTVRGIRVENAVFAGRRALPEERDRHLRAIRLTVNEDYPNTTPRGGIGYGVLTDYEVI